MFSTFVGLERFISCQRPDYTIGRNYVVSRIMFYSAA